MIDIIYLKKSGLYTRFKKEYKKIDRSISYYLHHTPKIEKDFTVGDLMEILKEYEHDVNLVFMAYTRRFEINPFYEEMNLSLENVKENLINHLEFSWRTDVDNLKEFGKPKYEMSDSVDIIGKKSDDKERYGISLSPLNELKDATFKLNKKIKFSKISFGEIWEEDRKMQEKVFFEGVKEFTFQDIIGAFLNEITYHGYPEDKKDRITELDESFEQSKTGEGIPFEVIQLEWKEKFLSHWQKKKESKNRTLHIEKLEKEIAFLKGKLGKE